MRSDHLFISDTGHNHSIPIQDFVIPNNAPLLTEDDLLNKRIQVKKKSQVKPSQEKKSQEKNRTMLAVSASFVN